MSQNTFGNDDEVTRKVAGAQNLSHTQELPTDEPQTTKSFEVPQPEQPQQEQPQPELPSQEPAATTEPNGTTGAAEPTEPARPETSSIPEAPQAPMFRPENESRSPEPGFVGYITAKRGPQAFPNPEPPQATTAAPAPPAPPVPMGHPGIRTSTIIVGLILLAIGVTALTAQLSAISVNPAAVALAVMLGAGVTLMAAAIRRTQKH